MHELPKIDQPEALKTYYHVRRHVPDGCGGDIWIITPDARLHDALSAWLARTAPAGAVMIEGHGDSRDLNVIRLARQNEGPDWREIEPSEPLPVWPPTA